MIKLLKALTFKYKTCNKGIASIEFAVWSTFLLIPFIIGLEFGLFSLSNSKLTKATNAGALTAFDTRNQINATHIEAIVKSTYNDEDITVKIACNGEQNSCVNTNRSCSCIEADNSEDADESFLFELSNCSSVCPSGAAPGYYLTIDATVKSPMRLSTSLGAPNTVRSVVTVKLD